MAPDPEDARGALFFELIDYAGLFPPASLSMRQAVEEYRRGGRGAQRWMLGRFICPASRLEELRPFLGGEERWRLSVLADRPAGGDWRRSMVASVQATASFAEKSAGAGVEVLEGRLPEEAAELRRAVTAFSEMMASTALDVRPFLEVRLGDQWEVRLPAALEAISQVHGLGAKIRCGGATPEHFPSPRQVAVFIASCVELGVSFKATAGLHHPFRHLEPTTGVVQHGFLNLLGGAVLSHAHLMGPLELEELVGDQRPSSFTLDREGLGWRGRTADPALIGEARRIFVAYGSCSFEEPVGHLVDLGML